jgi:predicted DNA-binding transcriptional regulator AlpA
MRELRSIKSTVLLLSRQQLADRWGCSIETIKRRERAGTIRPVILGRLVRYREADIEAVEAAATVKGGA